MRTPTQIIVALSLLFGQSLSFYGCVSIYGQECNVCYGGHPKHNNNGRCISNGPTSFCLIGGYDHVCLQCKPSFYLNERGHCIRMGKPIANWFPIDANFIRVAVILVWYFVASSSIKLNENLRLNQSISIKFSETRKKISRWRYSKTKFDKYALIKQFAKNSS